ncbi:MAG TPA: ferritin-like domain-containing protein [Stellaceae bacterium]|nr:ferritin-like domain-containing protein [Stellaceae bacterium]
MSTNYRYTLPVEQSEWKFDGHTDVCFTWEYDENRDSLLQLYDKGKKQQWDAAERIDWSQDLDPENPMLIDDRAIPIFGSDIWNRMTEAEHRRLRHHQQASQISQFMHGEQGALIATSKIVQTVPDLDSKFYAATQVMDEARHVEAYTRLLHEKFELAYPITPGLKALLESGLSDNRWDMTYLTMQILIEGLALAAFQRLRDQSKNPLAASVNAYVMQDEARHVAFGRLALRDYYPKLTDAERAEREEFTVQACWHMRDRFNQREVFERIGLPVRECIDILDHSESMQMFRSRIFSRIVPTVRDIGLWSRKVQEAFAAMGAIEFATADAQAMLENDARVAEEFDAKMRLNDAGVAAAAE